MSDLFDFADEQQLVPALGPSSGSTEGRNGPLATGAEGQSLDSDDDLPDWEEVPQARFLSWSPEMQFAYCARRDQDSALRAESVEEFDWFTARAARYKELIK